MREFFYSSIKSSVKFCTKRNKTKYKPDSGGYGASFNWFGAESRYQATWMLGFLRLNPTSMIRGSQIKNARSLFLYKSMPQCRCIFFRCVFCGEFVCYFSRLTLSIMIGLAGTSWCMPDLVVGTTLILSITSMPSMTFPKTA